MTVNVTSPRTDYEGNGVATVVPFSFSVANGTDVVIFQRAADGTISKQTTGFQVSVNSDGVGGTVVFDAAPTAEERGVLLRVTPQAQATSIASGGPFSAKVVEYTFDQVVRLVQELAERSDRSLQFSPVNSLSGELKDVDAFKGRVLVFNSLTGLPEPGALSVDVAAVAGISAEITAVASRVEKIDAIGDDLALGAQSKIEAVATDLSLGEDSAIVLAQTSATVAASAAAQAQGFRNEASGYATTASGHANTASGHQDAAETAANQAVASATSAAASAGNAASAATSAASAAIGGLQSQIDALNYASPTITVDISTPTSEVQEIGGTVDNVTISINGTYTSAYEPITVEARQKSGAWADVTGQMTVSNGVVSGPASFTGLGLTSTSPTNDLLFEARISDTAQGSIGGGAPVESNEDDIRFRLRTFWSDGTGSAPINSAEVRALPNSNLTASLDLTLSPPPGTGTRTIYIAFPQSYVTGGQITVTFNGATASTVPTSDASFSSISVNDAGGTATDYWLYALVVNNSVSSVRVQN